MRSRSTREGSVGLLILLGLVTIGGIIFWLRGAKWGRNTYQIIVDFPQADGVKAGSAVLFRGVRVGQVISINAKTNGVEAVLQISPAELQIPPQVVIEPSRFGLIGEAVVAITPSGLISEEIGDMTAVSEDCDSQIIICDQDRLQGKSSGELLTSLSRLAEIYSDPEFYENFINATKNLSLASEEIISLAADISGLTQEISRELKQFSANANQISSSITETADEINSLTNELILVSNNINDLIDTNRDEITTTIASINQTSDELRQSIEDIRPAIANINSALADNDLNQFIGNLEVLSANLRDFTDRLNDDGNTLILQQTLDSARATFANAEKITADIDQLTGDPQFRNNLRRLVNGLSQLVSSGEQLEQQVQTAVVLNNVTEQVEKQLQPIKTAQLKHIEADNIPRPILNKPFKQNYTSQVKQGL